jgi:hypothetical protein
MVRILTGDTSYSFSKSPLAPLRRGFFFCCQIARIVLTIRETSQKATCLKSHPSFKRAAQQNVSPEDLAPLRRGFSFAATRSCCSGFFV